jgi:hypothetical protein
MNAVTTPTNTIQSGDRSTYSDNGIKDLELELELFLLLALLWFLNLCPLFHLITDDIVESAPVDIGSWDMNPAGC